MYLSRVEIDSQNRQKLRDLSHLGAYHNWVEQSFVDEVKNNQRSRKLWRIDELNGKAYLLIVSEAQPNLEALEKYGVTGSGECKLYDEFINTLSEGQMLRFKATLNPIFSKSTGKKSGKRGRVYTPCSIDEKLKYLMDKSLKNGFSLQHDDYYITHSNCNILKKKNIKDYHVSTVSYEGVLKITDSVAFRNALIKGIGKKRAYGCGMITVIAGT